MKNVIKKFVIGILFILSQTLLEVAIITLYSCLGLPFMGMNMVNENFIEIVVGVSIFFALTKIIFTGIPYIILFVLISSFWKCNYYALNGFLSLCLFIITITYFNRIDISQLNPFSAMIISSILLYFSSYIKLKNITKKKE